MTLSFKKYNSYQYIYNIYTYTSMGTESVIMSFLFQCHYVNVLNKEVPKLNLRRS